MKRAPQPVHRPGGDDIELAAVGILQHPVELQSLVPTLRSTDAFVFIHGGNVPAGALGHARKLKPLVFGRLLVCGNP